MKIEQLLREMVKMGSSDLHVKVGIPPVYRIDGELQAPFDSRVDGEAMESFLSDIMNDGQKEKFENDKEVDFAIGARALGRFRVNVFRQRGNVAMVVRHIKADIPPFATLRLPEVILDLSMKKRGLILVTGTTGSGKSTCLASMIDHVNTHTSSHIITIEDPIEFLHQDKKSIVTQREVGADTNSYANALRASLRQDPDVLLVGEIRDLETMSIALTAADTGHMVFATIHTTNATETISRILSMYPPHQHEEVRHLLAGCLEGIISLRLLPKAEGDGRAPAAEVMVNTSAITEYILDKEKTGMIEMAIAEGHQQYGSQTFDQSIFNLYQDDMISYEVAYQNATNPDDFDLRVRGIAGTSDRGWM
jgi:twitching motility protein PilT